MDNNTNPSLSKRFKTFPMRFWSKSLISLDKIILGLENLQSTEMIMLHLCEMMGKALQLNICKIEPDLLKHLHDRVVVLVRVQAQITCEKLFQIFCRSYVVFHDHLHH